MSLLKGLAWLHCVVLLCISQNCPAAVALKIGHNITGATYGSDSSALPPDAAIAVGPNQVAQLINGRYSVFSKTNFTIVRLQTKTDAAFFSGAGISYSGYLSDPRIIYDASSQRWFASMIDVPSSGGNHFLLAVSDNADPTSTWHGTSWTADPTNGDFADFPTLGVDAEGVYLSGDMFSGNNSVGALLDVIPKQDLLANATNIAGLTSSGVLSYATYGDILQPAVLFGTASSSEAVLAMGDLGYDFLPHSTLVSFSVTNANIENGAMLSSPATLTVPSYTIPINPPQPGGVSNLDNGDARISAMVHRVGDVLYAVHGVEVSSRSAIQWFVVNATDQTLIDTGMLTDPVLHLFYPAITANSAGTMVIVYNGCSTSTYISCYAVVAELINGNRVFGNPVLLKASTVDYRTGNPSTISRWGDYSSISPDPSDPTRFWSLTLYASSSTAWSTQISELILAPLNLTIRPAGTNVLVCWPASASASYLLQTSPALASANWASVGQTPVITNNQYCVTLPSAGAPAFFRLSQ